MKPQIAIEDFTYILPEEKIARYPLANRDDSKLLVFKTNELIDSNFKNLKTFLPEKALLVFNNTKVIRARLVFRKSTGAQIEIFCLEPAANKDMQEVFSSTQSVRWNCIVGNLKKWKTGAIEATIKINRQDLIIEATQISRDGENVVVEFNWGDHQISFGEILDQLGSTPIPPYLNRESEDIDTERYQTVYSQHKGSVAAPTAGLHFTTEVIDDLHRQGFQTSQITLHVGAGTFKQVKSSMIDAHEMHSELFRVNIATLKFLLNYQFPIIAVGTTTVRTLESLYWVGVKLKLGNEFNLINQWDPYEIDSSISVYDAFKAIIEYMNQHKMQFIDIQTAIMIAPGYRFRVIDGMVTNFHQPQSTLLLLISALIGDEWKRLYDYALTHEFRFLSYGDSSFLYNPRVVK